MAPRLDTRLSRLLLDEGRLRTDTLEDAVQQQVVHGGALDTILLELGLIDEEALSGALCIAWDTLPVPREDALRPAPEAAARLPGRVAAATGLCPFAIDDEGVHVLVSAPLDRALLDEVASLVNRPLVPHVVPEVRLRQALQVAYGLPLEERFASLARLLDGEAGARAEAEAADDVAPKTADEIHEEEAQGWDLAQALARLAAQDSREGIARVALAYARRALPFAAVFGVRQGAAIGWARSGACEGVQFEKRPLPVPEGSLLEQLLESPSPLLGKPPLNDGNLALLGWLGRRRPATALLIPISVAKRTVAVLYADGGIRARGFEAVSDLVAFGARVGPAFEALLRARRRAHADLFQRAREAEHRRPAAPAPLEARAAIPAAIPVVPPVETAPVETAPVETVPEESALRGVPRDGTSPFARGYTAPPRPAPPAPKAAPEPEAPPYPSLVIDRLSADDATLSALATLEVQTPRSAPADDASLAPPSPDAIDDWGEIDADEATGEAAPQGGIAGFEPDEEEMRLDTAVAAIALAHADDDEPEESLDSHALDWREGVAGGLPRALRDDGASDASTATGGSDADDAHAADEDEAAIDASEVVGDAWTSALVETVARGHQGGEAFEAEQPVLDDEEAWEDVVLDGAYARALDEPRPVATPPVATPPVATSPAEPGPHLAPELGPGNVTTREIEELVTGLESLHPRVVAEAKQALKRLGDEALFALEARFPGRLLVDPFTLDEAPGSAAELGPLLEVLEAMGPVGLEAAIPHLDARFPAHRYAATYMFLAIPDERCLDVLRPRLADHEPRVRRLAAEALAQFMAHPRFEPILVHLRDRLASPMPEARQRAIWLLGFFRDVGAVPLLIPLLDERNTLLVDAARSALRQITLQDLEPRAKVWDKWWEKARKRSRIDWLIEGLQSRDRDLRYLASTELSRLVGSDFGYRCDDPKRERDAAVKRYERWWAEERTRLAAG